MLQSRLIVGLGNPTAEYKDTRHNIGFKVVERLAVDFQVDFSKDKMINGLLAKVETHERSLFLLKPLSFMNNSGVVVKKFLELKGIVPDDLLVICDDFNIDFGQLRLRSHGSDGGHNGLKSVIAHLKTQMFPRLRLGVGAPPNRDAIVEFVLNNFNVKEKGALNEFIDRAAQCCSVWLSEGNSKAMSQFNKKG